MKRKPRPLGVSKSLNLLSIRLIPLWVKVVTKYQIDTPYIYIGLEPDRFTTATNLDKAREILRDCKKRQPQGVEGISGCPFMGRRVNGQGSSSVQTYIPSMTVAASSRQSQFFWVTT